MVIAALLTAVRAPQPDATRQLWRSFSYFLRLLFTSVTGQRRRPRLRGASTTKRTMQWSLMPGGGRNTMEEEVLTERHAAAERVQSALSLTPTALPFQACQVGSSCSHSRNPSLLIKGLFNSPTLRSFLRFGVSVPPPRSDQSSEQEPRQLRSPARMSKRRAPPQPLLL